MEPEIRTWLYEILNAVKQPVYPTTAKKVIFLTFLTLLMATTLSAQIRVANYSFGKPGTDNYEHFDFWTKGGKSEEINYAYGKDRKEVKLCFLGKERLNGSAGFKVRFNNNYVLYIIPKGNQLQVIDTKGKYNKRFSWEYEGPVNGVGMFCDVCAADEDEAMNLIQSNFLK